MKCIKCKTDNVHNANYCKKCAYEFSEKEQEAAESKTFVGFLKKLEKIKDVVSLEVITDKLWFKILSIVAVLGVGVYFALINGINLKLEESTSYTGNYNEKLDEYYLYSDDDKTELNLYVPNRTDKLVVSHYDNNNELILEKEYKVDESIILETNSDDYYIIEAKYKKDSDKLKVYIYQVEAGE